MCCPMCSGEATTVIQETTLPVRRGDFFYPVFIPDDHHSRCLSCGEEWVSKEDDEHCQKRIEEWFEDNRDRLEELKQGPPPPVTMNSVNKGLVVGGPFDGKEHDFVFYPDEFPNGPPPKVSEIWCALSKEFPEGAEYHWNSEKKEWHYVGQLNQKDQNNFRELLGLLGVEPDPPL